MNLYVSFSGEGPTDTRFFKNLTERIINDVLLRKGISANISWMPIKRSGNSQAAILTAAKESKSQDVLICHKDSDKLTRDETIENHFQVALDKINADVSNKYCNKIVLAIPIQETESWMLCDKNLLKELIDTTLSNSDLGLTYSINGIESVANPKERIIAAINTHKNQLPGRKRRFAVDISELYEPFSQQVPLDKISSIESFQNFDTDVREAIEDIIEKAI